jgi:drug/metabolite transporter (DMT)-like permease
MTSSSKTVLIFIFFAALWGAAFPITQNALKYTTPYEFIFLRFFVAALLLSPWMFDKTIYSRHVFKMGILLGSLNAGIYCFETLALQYTSSARCAFIIGSSVILVPFFAFLFYRKSVTMVDLLSAGICVIGIYILSGVHKAHLNMGDCFAFISAIFVAISINYVQKFSTQEINVKSLTFCQLLFTCPIPLVLSFAMPPISWGSASVVWVAILFCAIFATVIPLFGQMKLQKHISSTQAALTLSTEPIFASLVAYGVYHQKIALSTIVGGSLILLSILFATLMQSLKSFITNTQ